MPSIGELFIQLAVMGNANELKKANAELQKANILTQKQNKLDKLRAEYLEKIQKAQNKQEKRELAKQYKAKKQRIEEEANIRLRNLEHKSLQRNIAQWSTYAHAVSMASSVAINSLKSIYNELDKVMNYGLNMKNIGMTTSTSINALQGYGRVAHILNPQVSEEAVMQQVAKIDQAYAKYLGTGIIEDVRNLLPDMFPVYGSKAERFYGDVLGGKIKSGIDFLEGLREVISGESPEQQTNILREAGLEHLLPMLNMSRSDFELQLNRAMKYALSDQELKEQADTAIAVNEFKENFKDFVQKVFGTFTPLLNTLVNQIKENLPKIYSWVEKFAQKVKDHLPQIEDFIKRIFNYVFKGELAKLLKQISYVVNWIAKLLGFKDDEYDPLHPEYDVEKDEIKPKENGNWADNLQTKVNNWLLHIMDKIGPDTAIPEYIRQARNEQAFQDSNRSKILNNMYNKDNSVKIETFNFTSPTPVNNAYDFGVQLGNLGSLLQTGTP